MFGSNTLREIANKVKANMEAEKVAREAKVREAAEYNAILIKSRENAAIKKRQTDAINAQFARYELEKKRRIEAISALELLSREYDNIYSSDPTIIRSQYFLYPNNEKTLEICNKYLNYFDLVDNKDFMKKFNKDTETKYLDSIKNQPYKLREKLGQYNDYAKVILEDFNGQKGGRRTRRKMYRRRKSRK
jgi:hypothetical protein